MGTRRLIVEVVGDSRSLERTFAASTRSTATFGNEMTRTAGRVDLAFSRISKIAAGGFLGGIAAGAAIQGMRRLGDSASDLNEQITKSQRVFEDSADSVLDWSRTTARAIGVSQEQALEAAGTFGNLFASIRLGSGQAADISRRLVQLAADLASFNNASPEDTLAAIRSGLVGEAEPLRRYGVLLSEARVQQLALQQTGKDSVKQLTDQDKALARVAIIFRDTAKAQGDFARTSGGLANQQRILKAEVADLEANLGRLLLPVITKIVGVMADAAGGANTLVDGLRALGNVRIPTIHIPFAFDIPGGGLFDRADDIFTGIEKNLPFNRLALEIGQFIAAQFEGATDSQTPELAAQFKASLGGFFQDALDQAMADVPAPSVKATPGFATGLKPEDILGPLIKDIPKKLQEALLDVQIASPDNAQALIAVLEKQKNVVLEALDDPRLNRDDRIALKQKLKGVESAIDAQNAAIQATIQEAKDKREATIDKARRAAEDAKRKIAESFANMVESLQLGADRAGLTKRLDDDLNKLLALQAGLEKQVKAGVNVAAAQSQLVSVAGQIADKQREIQERAAEAEQARQFRALGLSVTGEKIVPGVENLRKRIDSALRKFDSGDLKIGSKLVRQLRLARALIVKEGDGLKRDTRSVIDGWLDSLDTSTRQVDRRTIQLSDRILKALGFGRDFDVTRLRKLEASSLKASAFAQPAAGTRTTGGVSINGPITVVADNPDAFLRELQKRAGRTSASATGRFPGRSLGLG